MRKQIAIPAAVLVGAGLVLVQAPAQGTPTSPARGAALGKLRPAVLNVKVNANGKTVTVRKQLPFLSTGVIAAVREGMGLPFAGNAKATTKARAQGAAAAPGLGVNSEGCRGRSPGLGVRVNTDCGYRRQAETDIAYNPADRNNLLAGQNDSRVGWNQTGIDFSTDNGKTWGDMIPPFRYRLNAPETLQPAKGDPNRHTILGTEGDLHSYDACSDPAVAFDSRGRGFYSAICFDIAYTPSLLFVTTSPQGAKGSWFDQVPPPYGLIPGVTGREHIVAEDNSARVFHDKEFIVADTYANSRNRDNVYVTWTVFRFEKRCGENGELGYCGSPIYGSMSTDHGFTWSTPELVSRSSRRLCTLGNALDPRANPHACNFDQGSDPTVLPNGDLVVSFNNGNTPTANQQVLAVRCTPRGSSTAGTARLNCGSPSKVGDQITENSPRCDFGRGPEQCVPGTFVRAPNETSPRIAVNERNGNVFVTWFDYRNAFVINLARSADAGRTWSQPIQVHPDAGYDHYFPGIDVAEVGNTSRIGIVFYRTERIPNENNTPPGGFKPGMPGVMEKNTQTRLAGGTDLNAASYQRVTISPTFPPPDGIQAGFLGDYNGLTINRGQEAHPIWADTRNRAAYPELNEVTVDEDAFTIARQLPGAGR
jgi:hypothetical protein